MVAFEHLAAFVVVVYWRFMSKKKKPEKKFKIRKTKSKKKIYAIFASLMDKAPDNNHI